MWRSLSHYWEDMGGDPELEPQDDEELRRQAEAEIAAANPTTQEKGGQVDLDLPF